MKKKTRGQLVKDLDKAFSRYIRLRDSFRGEATCVTCGDTKQWKQMQAGHFYTRGRYPTRWHEDNVHVQCYRCNVLLKGNYIKYTRFMLARFGEDLVDELETISLSSIKIPTPTLKEMIEDYEGRVTQMLASSTSVRGVDKLPTFGV